MIDVTNSPKQDSDVLTRELLEAAVAKIDKGNVGFFDMFPGILSPRGLFDDLVQELSESLEIVAGLEKNET